MQRKRDPLGAGGVADDSFIFMHAIQYSLGRVEQAESDTIRLIQSAITGQEREDI